MKNFFKKNLSIILITALSLAIRFLFICKYGNYWDDEMFSVVYSQKPWIDSIFKFWIWETNPPLHMVILKLWFYIFPVTEFWARVPGIIFGALSCWAMYNFARRVFSARIAGLAAFILALSPDFIFYSVTARTYALLILLTILSCDYFFRIFIEKKSSKKNIYLYALFTLLILYTHLTAIEVLFSQFIILLIVNRALVKQWITINLIPGLLWLFWAIFSLAYKANPSTANGAWFLHLTGENNTALKMLQLIFVGPVDIFYGAGVIILFTIALFFLLRRQIKNKKTDLNLFLIFVLAFIPIAIFFLMNLLNIRFILISLPYVALVGAYLAASYFKNAIIQYLFIFLLLIPGVVNVYHMLPINDWTGTNMIISQKINPAKKQIIINDFFNQKNVVEKYFSAPIPLVTYFPFAYNMWDYYLITQNYLFNAPTNDTTNFWMRENKINDYNEIFFIYVPRNGEHILTTLKENGWKQKGAPIKLKTATGQYLMVLEK